MADNVQLQGIEFEIVSSADKTTASVGKLAKTLESLKSATKGVNLYNAADNLEAISDSTQNMNAVGVGRLASALGKICGYAGDLGVVSDYLGHIASLDFSNLSGARNAISDVSKAILGSAEDGMQGSGLGLEAAAYNLKLLAASVGNLSSDGVERLSTSLSTISGYVEPLGNVADLLLGISQMDFANLTTAANALGGAFNTSGVGEVTGALQGLDKELQQKPKDADKASQSLNKVGSSASKSGKSVKNALGQFAKAKIGDAFSRAIAPVKNFGKGISNLANSFKRILFYRAIRTVIKEIGDAFKTGVSNVYQWSKALGGSFAQSMDNAASSMQYLKNSIGAAVAPIINSLVPVLEIVVDKVVDVINAFNRLFAILGGQSSWTRAIKGAAEWAETAESGAKAAKDFTLGIDELNVINDSGRGGGSTAQDFGSMFEDVALEGPDFDSWGDKFNFFLSVVLSGISKLQESLLSAADSFNGFNEKLLAAFKMDGVLEKVQQIGTDLATALNNVVAGIQWGTMGQALGAGLNLALEFLVSLVYGFDWVNFGEQLAESFNGLVDEVDWYAFGQLLWAGFKIGIETLAGFLQNTDMVDLGVAASDIVIGFFDSITDTITNIHWYELGHQIATFLENIDWDGVADSLFTALGAAIGGIGAFIVGLFEDSWNATKEHFDFWINEAGGNVALGILAGIGDVLVNIGTWIYDHIFKPFIEGFKKAFDIHSPSGEMETMGGYVIGGMLDGIINGLLSIGTWLKEHIFDPIMDGLKDLFGISGNGESSEMLSIGKSIADGIASGIEDKISAIKGVLNKIIDVVENAINWIVDKLNALSFKVPDWVPPPLGGQTFGFNIPRVSIPRLENGGFVGSGQMFIAREAGPELVGSIGNKTAVANNDQIVSSVASGVAEANEEQNRLLEEQNALLRAILAKTGVSIDGKAIKAAYDRANRDAGASIMAGGVFA